MRYCNWCAKPYEPDKRNASRQHFCSAECRVGEWRERRPRRWLFLKRRGMRRARRRWTAERRARHRAYMARWRLQLKRETACLAAHG
jgi:hypothetical protein